MGTVGGKVMDAIERFFEHFERQLARVERTDDRLFQKILIMTFLGALARGRYPRERSDRQTFTSLILDHSGWAGAVLVSYPQLRLQIERQQFAGLTEQFLRRLEMCHLEWQRSLNVREVRRSRLDPRREDLNPAASTPQEERLLASCNHANLLYDYRSTLVHEFREPGYPSEISPDGTEPYYVSTSTIDSDEEVYELVYPSAFLLNLARDAMNGLKSYYQEREVDPYAGYRFGSVWRQR